MSGDNKQALKTMLFLRLLEEVGRLLPDMETLEKFREAKDREETLGPVFYPAAYRQSSLRMKALGDVLEAAIGYKTALQRLNEARKEEGDPGADAAAILEVAQFYARAKGQGKGGNGE